MTYSKQEKLNRIYEVIMGISKHIECFDCLRKKQLTYPGTVNGVDGKCDVCGYEGKNIGLIRTHTMYDGKCNIGDCLDWLDSQEVQKIDGRHPAQRSLLIIWKSKRLPIDEQSDECIDYIYSIIK